jgi:hypothetical protein
MTDQDTTNTRSKNAPSHRLFSVIGDGESARWTDIGVAWATRDGKGFTLTLNAVPMGGRIVMRINDDKATAKKKGS